MANRQRDPNREVLWRKRLKQHAGSGLSVREFCRSGNLRETSFYYWRREIAQRDAESKRERGSSEATHEGVPEFLPVQVMEPISRAPSVTIELIGGRLLRLPESIGTERLVEIVQALEAREAS